MYCLRRNIPNPYGCQFSINAYTLISHPLTHRYLFAVAGLYF